MKKPEVRIAILILLSLISFFSYKTYKLNEVSTLFRDLNFDRKPKTYQLTNIITVDNIYLADYAVYIPKEFISYRTKPGDSQQLFTYKNKIIRIFKNDVFSEKHHQAQKGKLVVANFKKTFDITPFTGNSWELFREISYVDSKLSLLGDSDKMAFLYSKSDHFLKFADQGYYSINFPDTSLQAISQGDANSNELMQIDIFYKGEATLQIGILPNKEYQGTEKLQNNEIFAIINNFYSH